MPIPLAAIAAVALLCSIIYASIIKPAFLSPLAKLPVAHPLCRISERWLEQQQKKKQEPKALYAAHKACGPIVRIGPNEVSVNSSEGLRSIYTAGLEKHPFYLNKFEHYNGRDNMICMLDHKSHSVRKRMISSVYAKSYLQHSADVAEVSRGIIFDRFLPLLQQCAKDVEQINVLDLWQWSGIDFYSAYTFGTGNSTDFLRDKAGREAYFGEWNQYSKEYIGDKTIVEGLCMRMLVDAVSEQTSENEKEGTKPLLAGLLHSQLVKKIKAEDAQCSREELMKQCASELLDNMVAAHETLAITMTYITYRLSLDLELQRALHAELLTLDPPVRPSASALPAADQIDNLSLLNGIIMETLRLHAPVPGHLPRVAPPAGMALHGHFIPAGTAVSCNAYTLHRNEEFFPRPFEWLPHRWLGDKERLSLGENFPPVEVTRRYMWAFGSGGRMCTGSNFALQVLKLLVAATYTTFTTHVIDDEGIEQTGDVVAGPRSNKLIVKFEEHCL